jgi:hypothetical protein
MKARSGSANIWSVSMVLFELVKSYFIEALVKQVRKRGHAPATHGRAIDSLLIDACKAVS